MSKNMIEYIYEKNVYTIRYLPSKIEYRKNGLLHREDGPAVIFNNGCKQWWINGNIHRDNDLPAIEDDDGNKSWYKENKLHRDNDLPAVEDSSGYKAWYKEGEVHRLTSYDLFIWICTILDRRYSIYKRKI